jgi:hypothetical protein
VLRRQREKANQAIPGLKEPGRRVFCRRDHRFRRVCADIPDFRTEKRALHVKSPDHLPNQIILLAETDHVFEFFGEGVDGIGDYRCKNPVDPVLPELLAGMTELFPGEIL